LSKQYASWKQLCAWNDDDDGDDNDDDRGSMRSDMQVSTSETFSAKHATTTQRMVGGEKEVLGLLRRVNYCRLLFFVVNISHVRRGRKVSDLI
jgi:hypothetical protein